MKLLGLSFSSPENQDVYRVMKLLWSFSLIGIISMLVPTTARIVDKGWVEGWQCLGGGLFLCGAATVGGGLLGFLFGVPKTNVEDPTVDDGQKYTPNTNLELISDWLTKIIVGLGLVQFGELIDALKAFGKFAGPVFGDAPLGATICIAIVVHYSVIGFVQGFLLAYLWLPGAFRRANKRKSSPALVADKQEEGG